MGAQKNPPSMALFLLPGGLPEDVSKVPDDTMAILKSGPRAEVPNDGGQIHD